jgi:cell division protein FtsZ
VKSVMQGAGSALMGIGSARGEDRAVQAAELAISSPLLEASIDGAYGVLLSIQGGSDLGLFEINEAARLVQEAAHPEANIIFGAVIDDALGDEVRVTVIAAGFDGGVPTQRKDDRALGQITGSSTSSGIRTAPPAAPAAPSYAGNGASNGHGASQRPYSTNGSTTASEPAPVGADAADNGQAPAPSRRDEPVVVPETLEPVRARAPRSVVFDDADDELDVPDFLK